MALMLNSKIILTEQRINGLMKMVILNPFFFVRIDSTSVVFYSGYDGIVDMFIDNGADYENDDDLDDEDEEDEE